MFYDKAVTLVRIEKPQLQMPKSDIDLACKIRRELARNFLAEFQMILGTAHV